jgi:hypothetical protein
MIEILNTVDRDRANEINELGYTIVSMVARVAGIETAQRMASNLIPLHWLAGGYGSLDWATWDTEFGPPATATPLEVAKAAEVALETLLAAIPPLPSAEEFRHRGVIHSVENTKALMRAARKIVRRLKKNAAQP